MTHNTTTLADSKDSLADLTINFNYSTRPGREVWETRGASWPAFVDFLFGNHPTGAAFVPGVLLGGRRSKTAVEAVTAVMVETQGVAIDILQEGLDAAGWAGAVVARPDNGRVETMLPHDSIVKWLGKNGGGEVGAEGVARYLEAQCWDDDLIASVEVVDTRRATRTGAMVVLNHDPMPSYLFAVPLDPPYVPTTAAGTHVEGMKQFGEIVAAVAYQVGLSAAAVPVLSQSELRDPARAVALPNPAEGVAGVVVEGAALDWTTLNITEPVKPVVEASASEEPRQRRKRKRAAGGARWTDGLILSEKGNIISNLPNLQLILENDPRTAGVAAYNSFTGEVVLRAKPSRKPDAKVQLDGADWTPADAINGDLWSDAHDDALRAMLESAEEDGGYDLRVSDRDLKAAISLASKVHAFHPVRDYLSGLTWDQEPRVESLFVDYLGADDDAYHREAAKLMMIGAVARAFEPGMKIDESVILEGLQGKRKSTFIETLAVNWYGELEANMDDAKGAVEQMQGAWILEMGELTGMAKADVRRTKSFLSRHTDKARLAYARRAREFPRGCIFIGSTNDTAYLRDPSGGRRFLPVACKLTGTIDIESLRGEIDQLWAEAVHIYMQMRKAQPVGRLPLWLSDDTARTTARALQSSRTIDTADDMLTGQIEAWLEKEGKVRTCLREIWEACLIRDVDSYTNAWANSLGQIMRGLPSWEATGGRETFDGYGQQRAFRLVAA